MPMHKAMPQCGLTTMLVLVFATHGSVADEMAEVKATLLQAYGDPAARPSGNAGPPDQVQVQLYIDRLHAIDEAHMTYGFDGYLRSWWHDPRLRYAHTNASSSVQKLTLTRSDMQRIWKPGLYWEKAINVRLPSPVEAVSSGAGQLLDVYPDGRLYWSAQVSLEISCPLNLAKLPFDTQTCDFTMGMYSATADEVQLTWKVGSTALANWDRACLKSFVATRLVQDNVTLVYPPFSYTYAHATLDFTRRPFGLILAYVVPAIVLVFISMLGFLTDPNATPARVALGIITILCISWSRSLRPAGPRSFRLRLPADPRCRRIASRLLRVVLTNFVALTRQLPSGNPNVWLSNFLLVSIIFNVLAFVEQVAVGYGLQAEKWLREEKAKVELSRTWRQALKHEKHALIDLFNECVYITAPHTARTRATASCTLLIVHVHARAAHCDCARAPCVWYTGGIPTGMGRSPSANSARA